MGVEIETVTTCEGRRARPPGRIAAVPWSGRALAGLLALALSAAGACNKAPETRDDREAPVAFVGGDTITVGHVADYMRAARLDRTKEGAERAVEDLIGAGIVKAAAKRAKLTPEQETMRRQWEGQLQMYQFRDSVIYKTVSVPDSSIEAYYKDRVSEEVKARHILIPLPATATADEKSAARAKAEEALGRARADEDFAKLSREYSEPKTAAAGGDLGWFGKGDMVPAFESAAFALKPGEISDIVETHFGYHVIKVEDRRKKTLQEARPEIEQTLATPLRRQAEERYVEKMMAESGLQFYEVNVDTLVTLFSKDSVETLPASTAGLAVAKWDKGQLTVGDVVELYRTLPPQNRDAVKALDRDRMMSALAPLVRNRMLVARAEASGIQLDPERKAKLDERVQGLVVGDMLRKQVLDDVTIGESALAAAYRADSAKYAGKSLAEATPEIKQTLVQDRMRRANSQEGQRELVHELAKKIGAGIEVKRVERNYTLVLAQLAPADTAGARSKSLATGSGPKGKAPAGTPAAAGAPSPSTAATQPGAAAGAAAARAEPADTSGAGAAGGRPR